MVLVDIKRGYIRRKGWQTGKLVIEQKERLQSLLMAKTCREAATQFVVVQINPFQSRQIAQFNREIAAELIIGQIERF